MMTARLAAADKAVTASIAALLAACTERDQAMHAAALDGAVSLARTARDEAVTTAGDLARQVEDARTSRLVTFAADAAADLADLERQKANAATAAAARKIQVQLDAARTVAGEAAEAAGPERERLRQLQAQLAGANARLTDLEAALRDAEAAVASPGRAPVSERTMQLLASWWAIWPPVKGLPELTVAEQQARHGRCRIVAASPEVKAEFTLPDMSWRNHPQAIPSRA